MTLEEQFKFETKGEVQRHSSTTLNPDSFHFYSNEYVWWLEKKLESNEITKSQGE